jgi:UDP-N-acetylglucosamine/UDP-N-acetylgalactosamine diphosphorylase
MRHEEKIEALRRSGVDIPAPQTLEIGDEVNLEAVRGPGTVLHMGTKLYGSDLLVMPGTRIGYEEPATLENCAVGRGVELRGGYHSGAVYLDRATMGKGAQIRGGTLLEEEANGAHTVGLKQTILLPFVTLGSLVNFCDILMAGGTSRRDHSEVGSSFIHFNFTPFGRSGDKATPSLVGDVPRGVMLRSPRIFLGGQAGLVGPVQIDYGTVLAAGFVYRLDHGPDELVVGERLASRVMQFNPNRYGRISAKVTRNLRYIGNLVALWHWYERVRRPLARGDLQQEELYRRAQATVAAGVLERVKRLGQVAAYMPASIAELERAGQGDSKEVQSQRRFADTWDVLDSRLRELHSFSREDHEGLAALQAAIARCTAASGESTYIETLYALEPEGVAGGTAWLQSIVCEVEALWGQGLAHG